MSNLRLELRFKNARLFEEIEKRFRAEVADKYGCCSLAARTIGVSITSINGYLTLRETPWSWANGKESLRPSAQKIADFFLADPYELFPINLYRLRIPRLVTKIIDAERYISFAEARKEKLLPASTDIDLEDAVSADELRDRLESVFETLTPREAKILKLRFGLDGDGERTLEECGEQFGVTKHRIRQIEAKALSKLRHPSRSRKLRRFVPQTTEAAHCD